MSYCRIQSYKIAPLLLAVGLVLAMIGCTTTQAEPQPTATMEPQGINLTFVDVGYGDCIIIETNGRTLMVDTGKDEDFPRIARYLIDREIKTIDTVFITHAHKDHIGGLKKLSKTFDVQHVIIGAAKIDYDGVLEKVGVPVHSVEVGEVLKFGELSLEVIHPKKDVTYKKENDRSLTLRGEFQDFSFLLTGDIENVSQKDLVEAKMLEPVTVLKVPNHGDIDAYYGPFYEEIRPQFAVFTCEKEVPPANDLVKDHVKTLIPLAKTGTYQMTYTRGNLTHGAYAYEAPEGMPPRIAVTSVDAKKEEVILENQSGEDISLYGWYLHSSKGDEIYYFEEDATIQAGEQLSIVSGKDLPVGDIRWSEKNIINKENDIITIYDNYNRAVSMNQPN